MPSLYRHDPTQTPSLHNDEQTFDDPVRRVGADATATFDNSPSNPTEWAGSEALEPAADSGSDEDLLRNEDVRFGVRGDAIDTGINDADLRSVGDDDEVDDEDVDDDEDEDEDDETGEADDLDDEEDDDEDVLDDEDEADEEDLDVERGSLSSNGAVRRSPLTPSV